MATDAELDRVAAAVNALRPDWPARSVRTFLEKHRARGWGDLAVALAVVACDPATTTPARIDNAGPWWLATRYVAGHPETYLPGPLDERACALPGHEHEPARACRACAAERIARPDDHPDAETLLALPVLPCEDCGEGSRFLKDGRCFACRTRVSRILAVTAGLRATRGSFQYDRAAYDRAVASSPERLVVVPLDTWTRVEIPAGAIVTAELGEGCVTLRMRSPRGDAGTEPVPTGPETGPGAPGSPSDVSADPEPDSGAATGRGAVPMRATLPVTAEAWRTTPHELLRASVLTTGVRAADFHGVTPPPDDATVHWTPYRPGLRGGPLVQCHPEDPELLYWHGTVTWDAHPLYPVGPGNDEEGR